MENFTPIQLESNENSITISNSLKSRIEEETIPNYNFVISQINKAFEEAIATEDFEKKKDCLKIIENYENYLGEKYRDDADQRAYIVSVKEGIAYLKTVTA
jgi:hypothetical protein